MVLTIQDVTGNPADLIVLEDLLRIGSKCIGIWENFLLRDAPPRFSTDQTITLDYMKYKYNAYENAILDEPRLLETYTFVYKRRRSTLKYRCSNDMTLHHDIIIICYLNQVINRRHSHGKSEIIHTLVKLMKNKYNLKFITICSEFKPSHIDSKDVTIFDIALSFPNVSLLVFYCAGSPFCSALLPSFVLPRIIFAPTIISVLPKSVKNPPIAIIIAIYVKSDSLLKSQTSQTPLTTIFERILKCYNSDFFNELFKLHLCIKWGIVTRHKEEYKFVTRLSLYRQRAKNLIAELRSNDPDLENILSKI